MGKGNYRHLRSPEIETQKKDQKEMMSLIRITTGILTGVVLDFSTLSSATNLSTIYLRDMRSSRSSSGKARPHPQRWQSKQPEKRRGGDAMNFTSSPGSAPPPHGLFLPLPSFPVSLPVRRLARTQTRGWRCV